MRRAKTEAIIFKKKRLLDKDLLVTLFTEKFGKINAIAKGTRKITSRRLPHLQTGNLIEVSLYKKGQWYSLQETSLRSAFSEIKKNPAKYNDQYFVFFILDRLLPEEQAEDQVYDILKKFLIELAKKDDFTATDLERYLNQILKKLGYIKENKYLHELTVIVEELIHAKLPTHL